MSSLLQRIFLRRNVPRLLASSAKASSQLKNGEKAFFLHTLVQSQSKSQLHRFRWFVILSTSYLGYKLCKDKWSIIPVVNAASKFEGSHLAGRRQQYNFIADVVENSAPSVVYIEIKDTRRVDFFTGRPTTISNGSGFIVESDGLIVTNAHVVTSRPSAKVEVKLMNGKIYSGIVEDVDLKSDLATVRIPAKNLPIMKLGNSSELKPGEFVVAIGSPLALSNTVTSGVVSSVQRGSDELGLQGKDMIYIQTDAAITFGNSGGPLVNLDGEAIGVNSMKVTPGISFAIPIDYVKEFLKNAKGPRKSSDSPKRLYMGITMLTLTPQIISELQQRQEIPVPRDLQSGVLVWKVILGSPAHSGGLHPGDIVTHIDGQPMKSANDVYDLLKKGDTSPLKMSVTRLGKKVEVVVTPEDVTQ